MATYKDELEKIEAQEKKFNAQKKQLAKKKRQLKAQLAEEQAENEAKTDESTKQWFIDYCLKFNIDYELDTNYSCGSFLTLAGKSGQKFTEGMDLDGYFESGDKKALKKLVDEFYNQVQAIDALSSILKLSNKYGTDSLEFYTYEISRHGYCAWFNGSGFVLDGLTFSTFYHECVEGSDPLLTNYRANHKGREYTIKVNQDKLAEFKTYCEAILESLNDII